MDDQYHSSMAGCTLSSLSRIRESRMSANQRYFLIYQFLDDFLSFFCLLAVVVMGLKEPASQPVSQLLLSS